MPEINGSIIPDYVSVTMPDTPYLTVVMPANIDVDEGGGVPANVWTDGGGTAYWTDGGGTNYWTDGA